MPDFISEIKKTSTDKLIYWFSQTSTEMFKLQNSLKEIEIPVIRYGKRKRLCVSLSAWDIPNIAYLSVKFSNDYRNRKEQCHPHQLINLYRDYEDENSVAEKFKNSTLDDVFRILLGMTAEQFQYNNMVWIFERFNRNYYILLAASNFKHRSKLNVNEVVKKIFDCSAEDYIVLLLMIFWLCSQSPLPLTVPPQVYQRKETTILTKENLTKIVEHYTCSYNELRASPLGKQLLYSKPFIKTDRGNNVLMSSMFLVAMLLGNGLYWVVRDFFKEDGQTFVNIFGLLFEDYILDLANTYCAPSDWIRLEEGKKKGADFLFTLNNIPILIEAKSSLLGLDGKQQVPNSNTIDNFFQNTIQKAYQQLIGSCSQLETKSNSPILKIILLYDEFSNTAILQRSIEEIFLNDPTCYIMTIRELEILLYTYKNDKRKFELILHELILPKEDVREWKTISFIFNKLSLTKNHHFEGQMDYFNQMIHHLANQLK